MDRLTFFSELSKIASSNTTSLGNSNPKTSRTAASHLIINLLFFQTQAQVHWVEWPSSAWPLASARVHSKLAWTRAPFIGPVGQCAILQDGVMMQWRSGARDATYGRQWGGTGGWVRDNLPPHSEWKKSSATHVMGHKTLLFLFLVFVCLLKKTKNVYFLFIHKTRL